MRDPLDPAAITAALAGLADWHGDTQVLRRTVSEPNLDTALRLVGMVAAVADELDHHPEVSVDVYRKTVTFATTTHSAGDVVTEQDVLLAARIDACANALGVT